MLNTPVMNTPQSIDFSSLINQLNRASGFELHRLQCAIHHLLEEPHWTHSIRQQLSLGQTIDYFDPKANTLKKASIIEFKSKKVVIRNASDSEIWAIPYLWINVEGRDVRIRESNIKGLSRNEIALGDYVGFRDKANKERSGKIIRLNPKTASLIVGDQEWKVSYSLLHRVMDTDSSSCMDGEYTLISDQMS
jgi:hypothetical protein